MRSADTHRCLGTGKEHSAMGAPGTMPCPASRSWHWWCPPRHAAQGAPSPVLLQHTELGALLPPQPSHPPCSPPLALLAASPCSHCTEAADSAQQPGVPMHWERANFPAGPDFPRLPRTTASPAAAGSARAWPGQCGGPTAHTSAPLVQRLSGCCSTRQQPATRRFPSPVLELCPDTGRCL